MRGIFSNRWVQKTGSSSVLEIPLCHTVHVRVLPIQIYVTGTLVHNSTYTGKLVTAFLEIFNGEPRSSEGAGHARLHNNVMALELL